MGLVLVEGFDHFSTMDLATLKSWTNGNGTPTFLTAGAVSGFCCQFTGKGAGNPEFEVHKYLPATYTTLIVGFRFQILPVLAGTPAIEIFRIRAGNTNTCQVMVTSGGKIAIQNSSGTTIATGTAVVTANAFNYIEVKLVVNGASGSVQTQVNSAADIPSTTGNFGSTAVDNVQFVEAQAIGSTFTVLCDDVYACDTTGGAPLNTFLGDVHVETLFATGDGAHTDWTPNSGANHYSRINEHAGTYPDEDTTYNSSGTLNAIDSYTYPALVTPAGVVLAIQTNLWARKQDANLRQLQALVRRSAADYLSGTPFTLSTSYVDGTNIWSTDPSTGVAWTVAGVNAAEFGAKITV